MNLAQTVLKISTPKYRWKFMYRPIFKRSNIGGPVYRSVSSLNVVWNLCFCKQSVYCIHL